MWKNKEKIEKKSEENEVINGAVLLKVVITEAELIRTRNASAVVTLTPTVICNIRRNSASQWCGIGQNKPNPSPGI